MSDLSPNLPTTAENETTQHAPLAGSGAIAQGDGSVAAGEGGVAIGGNAPNATIITGIGNVVQIIKQYTRPSTLQIVYPYLVSFVGRNARLLVILFFLQLVLGALFLRYKERYLIDAWYYGLLAAMLMVATLVWHAAITRLPTQKIGKRLLVSAILLTMIWLLLFGIQAWWIVFPHQLPPDKFGIAIATFGEGSNFRGSANGREITSRVSQHLREAISNDPGLANVIELARIGIVGDDSKQAELDGERIGAKLIIWGRLVTKGQQLYVYFKVLQADSFIDNPDFPQLIPITNRELESTIQLPFDPTAYPEKTIQQQSLAIAAFSLGLAHYFDRHYRLAAEQFQKSLANLQPGICTNQQEVLASGKNLGLIYFYLGKTLQNLGDYVASQQMLECALVYTPDDLAVLLAQMYNYRVIKQIEMRAATFQKIIKLSYEQPSWAQTQAAYDRSLAYQGMEDYPSALHEYEEIIQEDPAFFIAYLGAANMLIEFKRFDEAATLYQKAEALAKEDAVRQVSLVFGWGRLYTQQGKTEAAIQAYEKAAALDKTRSVTLIYYELAKLYAKLGKKDDVIHNYSTLIQVTDLKGWAHSVFAEYLVESKDYPAAIDEYIEALRYPSYNDSYLRSHLALAYSAMGQKELALAEFEKALINPGDYEAYIRGEYGRVLYEFGQVEDARVQFEGALAVDNGLAIVTRHNLGQIYEKLGKRDKAIAMYQSLLQQCEQTSIDQIQYLEFAQEHLLALGVEPVICSLLPEG